MPHQHHKKSEEKKKFGKTIINDFKSGELKKGLFSDIKEFYYFYITDKDREQLKKMPFYKRWFIMSWWMLKMMFLKLTPIRRILLLIGMFLSITRYTLVFDDLQIHLGDFGTTIIIFILMLELKDKLLAKDELEVGRKVQKELLPKKNPEIDGWEIFMYTRPANEVGGDLVDYIEIDEKRTGIFLADVAGKGLGAALFMSKLQATIRALVPFYSSLTELGEQVNKIFRRDGMPNKFASLLFLELQPDFSKIKILNAGHFPPLICRNNKVEELEKGGAGIGLMDSPVFNEFEYTFEKSDCIFIYSDGITEAQNGKGDFFGEDRLLDTVSQYSSISVETAAKRILNEVARFVGNTRQSDDLSFIILKKK